MVNSCQVSTGKNKRHVIHKYIATLFLFLGLDVNV